MHINNQDVSTGAVIKKCKRRASAGGATGGGGAVETTVIYSICRILNMEQNPSLETNSNIF